MDLSSLECFLIVAEERSISRAATRLHITQPSLSERIRLLEQEAGRTLFDRLPRGVVLTEAGEAFVTAARRMLQEWRDAQRRAGDAEQAVCGTVAVGAIPTIAPFLLPEVLAEMSRRFPSVSIQVVEDVTSRLLQMVESGELDLALVSDHAPLHTLHSEKLADEPLRLMVSRQHALARGASVAWRQLAGERLLMLHELHCLSNRVSELCARRHVVAPIAMRGAQLFTLAGLVSKGLGVCIAPDMMARQDRVRDRVYVPLTRDSEGSATREIRAVWNVLRYRTNSSKCFLDVLGTQVKGLFTAAHPTSAARKPVSK